MHDNNHQLRTHDDEQDRRHPPSPHTPYSFDAVNAETHGVMKNRVNPDMSVRYGMQNQHFLLWLFDNHQHYGAFMKPSLLEELAVHHPIKGAGSCLRDLEGVAQEDRRRQAKYLSN